MTSTSTQVARPPRAMASALPTIVCREIETSDANDIVNLLVRGFPRHDRTVWERALRRLTERDTISGYPRYGYMLEVDGRPVGVLLLIFALIKTSATPHVRCCVSSWYVEAEARSYATVLVSRALRLKDVTYLNVSPAPHTHPILEAQGYRPFSKGTFVAVPALSKVQLSASLALATPGIKAGEDLSATEIELLVDHQRLGCLSIVVAREGQRTPFVFTKRTHTSKIAYADLVYCRKPDDFVAAAGPIGRFLLRYGIAFVMIDADASIPGLVGSYRPNRPKYYKGPNPPRLGDLAYCEVATLGL